MALDWLTRRRQEIDAALAALLPEAPGPAARLRAAMRYGLLGGGKRLRPLLCLAAAESVAGVMPPAALPLACALELLHAYSLIHDDLPALDNDDLRRGQPTCHKRFGEATAILAGDALLTLAFAQFADPRLEGRAAELLAVFSSAAAAMVRGQSADLESDAAADAQRVEFIHRHKTAAVIRAALLLGGMAASAAPEALERLSAAGEELGLAFQIVDDILDQTAAPAQLGKSAGKDQAQRKATYPAALGLEPSRRRAEALGASALKRLEAFGPNGDPLCDLAWRMFQRDR